MRLKHLTLSDRIEIEFSIAQDSSFIIIDKKLSTVSK